MYRPSQTPRLTLLSERIAETVKFQLKARSEAAEATKLRITELVKKR